jgi:UPF0755 protein
LFVKRILVLATGAVLVGVLTFTLALYFGITRAPRGGPSEPVRITVPAGQNFSALVDRLSEEGLLASPWAVKTYASMRGYDRHIKRGTYEFVPGERPLDILGRLIAGDVMVVDITVPEGFTIWDIAGAVQAAAIDSVEMLAALRDDAILRRRRIEAPSLEGYLFPDTYRVRWGGHPEALIDMMLMRLDDVFDVTVIQRASDVGMTPHQVLTLASIIEAETRIPEERTLVSAVYHNRLARNMRLEADPTVAYAMGGYKGRLLYADLDIDSPYNTYRHRGLPPGPICNAGRASILAALNPDSTSKALYFVARGDGSHVFSRTLREHRVAVEQVRRSNNSAGNRGGNATPVE